MAGRIAIHRFELEGRRYAIDPESCFCFECDAISWDVLAHYPEATATRINTLLREKHSERELSEVLGELEWLRATKSILALRSPEELRKLFTVERGLKRLTVRLPREAGAEPRAARRWFGRGQAETSLSAKERGRETASLLLNRSGEQKELELIFVESEGIANSALLTDVCGASLRAARLAGKDLTVAVRIEDFPLSSVPAALQGHRLAAQLEFRGEADPGPAIESLGKACGGSLGRLAKLLHSDAKDVTGRVIVSPSRPEFGDVVEALHSEGFNAIDLDVDSYFESKPDADPSTVIPALRTAAVYYAERLQKGDSFRLEPMASLFWRIYNGSPLRRSDPIGTNELAVAEDGAIYPSARLLHREEFRVGNVDRGELDEDALRKFDDVGSFTTSTCIGCWARNLCGGGNASLHYARTGSIRTPDETWCAMQRAWCETAVSAFNLLASQGINFTRIYQGISRSARPSLFTMLRAALRMTVVVRPVEESDAELLTRWENWNDATYFVYQPNGMLLATKYDREMDALHPQSIAQEMVIVRRNGAPIGLVKFAPDRLSGIARALIYLHRATDYADDSVRKGFRTLLKEAASMQTLRKLVVPAAEYDADLCAFLEAVGFRAAGVEREAIFLHNQRHDVRIYEAQAESLG